MIFSKQYKYVILLVILLLVGLWLRVRVSQDHVIHQWDEQFHALVAKNLLNHPLKPTLYDDPVLSYDYIPWFSSHIWLHKQPLPLWMIALSYRVFGISEFVTRLPSLLFSLLAIYITYLLGKYLFDEKTGVLAAFFMTVNGLVIELGAGRTATDHYDLLYMVFIELAILFAYQNAEERKVRYALLSGIFIAFAILTKWLPCLVVLILHYCFLKYRNWKSQQALKQIFCSIIPALLLALPWQLYILKYYPAEAKAEYYHNWLHITRELEGQGAGPFYFIEQIRINYSEILYLPMIYLFCRLIKTQFKDYKLLMLFLWIVIPILFFSIAKTKMQGYVLFVCPAFFFITADFFFQLKDRWIKTMDKKWLRVLSYLLLIAIIVLPVRYCFERTTFGFEAPRHAEYIETYKSFKGRLNKKSIILNVKEPIEFMFYNNCIAYPMSEISEDEKKSVFQKGYQLYYLNELEKKINVMN